LGLSFFDFDGLILDNKIRELNSHSPNTDTSCISSASPCHPITRQFPWTLPILVSILLRTSFAKALVVRGRDSYKMNPDSAVEREAMSTEQTFRSEVGARRALPLH
jgi:hypothetical protein